LPQSRDHLASWNPGPTKEAIVEFVNTVTTEGGPAFVPKQERVAVFDNDGTLWCEKPYYTQLAFVLDRVRALSEDHPAWRHEEPFAAILQRNRERLSQFTEHEASALVAATHAGLTPEEFRRTAGNWLEGARHPRFQHSYKQCAFRPMLDLLEYLRANDFKTYIVSGGAIDFVRAFSDEVYGIPPEQVLGSSIMNRFELRGDHAILVREPEVGSIDEGEGKPINIERHIGRHPIFAAGNSDGDLQMLQYTASRKPGFSLLVHHDDEAREYAYDRRSRVGRLDDALRVATENRWPIVSMRADWKVIF
jgi:phosphoserine phosphatase